ncbi:hypothetical protein B0I08_1138 [Glaciihabitans tibetensis]|uniref:Uncharacterized protein n=1 Tax=Glaciihabitans tibetensis TaxID=1266600 RepID=A0A2T0V2D0_9MICO|nr:hypothetical protein [Glaciihabitans tibetensis]PRY64301.1 hypothetical protein B0I08_1138 [Glaciihabitans tibetensis]
MKLIHYAGETLLTGDLIADAVLRYAGALAEGSGSATIVIPIRLPDGTVADANLLVGPASQLVAVPQPTDNEEIIDEKLIDRIELEIERLAPSHPPINTPGDDYKIMGAPSEWEL